MTSLSVNIPQANLVNKSSPTRWLSVAALLLGVAGLAALSSYGSP